MQARKYSVKSTPTKSKRNKSHKLEEVHDFSTMISVKINYGHGILSTQMSQVLLFLFSFSQTHLKPYCRALPLTLFGIHSFPNVTTELSTVGYHRTAIPFFGIPTRDGLQ